MSLSVKENRVVAVNRVGENTLQTVLQGKVELPSTAAPVGRVVWVKGTPVVASFATDQDRVYVQGAIDLTMVYEPETLEDEAAGLERVEWPSALPFDTHVEVIGAEPDMNSGVEITILASEWDLSSGQYSLDIDLIVAVKAKVDQVQNYVVISDVNVAQPVKLVTDGVVLNPLGEALQLPVEKEITGMLEFVDAESAVQTILDLKSNIQIGDTKFSEGKVEITGHATLEALYELNDLTIKHHIFEQALPFDLVFEQAEIATQMSLKSQIQSSVEGFVVNEGKNLRVELLLSGELLLTSPQPTQVLTHISAPGDGVEVRTELLALDSFVNSKEQQGIARGLVELGPDLPPIREILASGAVYHLTDFTVDEDKLVVEGVLDVEIFYLAHSEEDPKPLFRGYFPEVISFEQIMAVPGLELGMQPRISLEVLAVKPDLINRETLEVAITLGYKAEVVEYLEVEVAVEAVEVDPLPEDPPTLTYVFVQNGDSIWKLSRRYHTTEEAILDANPSLQDDPTTLKPGDHIYIPR